MLCQKHLGLMQISSSSRIIYLALSLPDQERKKPEKKKTEKKKKKKMKNKNKNETLLTAGVLKQGQNSWEVKLRFWVNAPFSSNKQIHK